MSKSQTETNRSAGPALWWVIAMGLAIVLAVAAGAYVIWPHPGGPN